MQAWLALVPECHAATPLDTRMPVRYTEETLNTIPEKLGTTPEDAAPRKTLSKLLEGPQKKEVQQCAKNCVATCVRGGRGALLRLLLCAHVHIGCMARLGIQHI